MKYFLILFTLMICCLSSCKETVDQGKIPSEPEVFEWTYAEPGSQGMSSEKLDELVTDLSARGTKSSWS